LNGFDILPIVGQVIAAAASGVALYGRRRHCRTLASAPISIRKCCSG
jgi:hypothetical protein